MHLLGIAAIIYVIYRLIKEACAPTLTAEHWANKELKHQDRMNGMSEKEILKNARKGRYYIPKEVFQAYPVPHREPDGKHMFEERIAVLNQQTERENVSHASQFEKRTYTVDEIQDILGISKTSAYRLVKKKALTN